MSQPQPTYQNPNLVCPEPNCGHQISKAELSNQDTSSFETFVDSLECPSCTSDIHPENAVLEYFDIVHLARDDDIPEISPPEASEDFQSVLSAILAVYRICRAERHRISEL